MCRCWPAARECHDADLPRFELHRKHERAPYPGLARQVRQPYARIGGRVGRPQGLLRLPRETRQAFARGERHVAGSLYEFLDWPLGHAPGFLEAQQTGLVVRAEVPAEVPAFDLAHFAHDRLEPRGGAVGIRDVAHHLVLEIEQLFAAFALDAGGRLRDRPLDGGRQAHQVVLQDVIGRAALQRANRVVLAQRAGNENERNVGDGLARDRESAHAVEVRHGEVREDDVGIEFDELAAEVLLALDAARIHRNPRALELARCEDGVSFDVLDDQDS